MNNAANYTIEKRGISYFGALLSIVMGYVLQNFLFLCSETGKQGTPILVIAALWFIFSIMIMMLMDKLGV
jgi:hypothetical protein